MGGPRQEAYLRGLGFARRPVVAGYDTVSITRIAALVADRPEVPWADRPFLYVGRFVPKKNLFTLLDAFALYVQGAGARRLVMAGDGPLRARLAMHAARLRVADRIDWPGFLDADGTAAAMVDALALCLPSTTEQWGLVVNEAAALGLPVIVSANVGARETLVREEQTGLILPHPKDPRALADPMHAMAAGEPRWLSMRACARAVAPAGDVRHFADGVEQLLS